MRPLALLRHRTNTFNSSFISARVCFYLMRFIWVMVCFEIKLTVKKFYGRSGSMRSAQMERPSLLRARSSLVAPYCFFCGDLSKKSTTIKGHKRARCGEKTHLFNTSRRRAARFAFADGNFVTSSAFSLFLQSALLLRVAVSHGKRFCRTFANNNRTARNEFTISLHRYTYYITARSKKTKKK